MTWIQAVLAIYGLLLIILGVMGYTNANSLASLIAGGASGLVALVCVWLAKSNPKVAYGIAALVCLAMIGNFLPKIIKAFKWNPGGIVVMASVVVLVCLIASFFSSDKSTNPQAP